MELLFTEKEKLRTEMCWKFNSIIFAKYVHPCKQLELLLDCGPSQSWIDLQVTYIVKL
jgi:hypothetical protein